MIRDKFSAVWVSHSSIGDYLRCPRAYYLNNVYRDPKTNHKISLMQPAKALGQTVHAVIDTVSELPAEDRLKIKLTDRFDTFWETVTGLKGGFKSKEEELEYKNRGLKMIERISVHPGPLMRSAVKIRQELPYFWLSEEDNIILCGKIDWLEYIKDSDGVRIIDFKTGKYDEDPDSLQLPIYLLLVQNTQKRPVVGVAYWYLERDDEPVDVDLPEENQAYKNILEISKKIALARKINRFVCKTEGGCSACRGLEMIISGKATFVGLDNYKQDVYVI